MTFGNINKLFAPHVGGVFDGKRLQWNCAPEHGLVCCIAITRRIVLLPHLPKLWQSELYWFW